MKFFGEKFQSLTFLHLCYGGNKSGQPAGDPFLPEEAVESGGHWIVNFSRLDLGVETSWLCSMDKSVSFSGVSETTGSVTVVFV